MFAALRIKKGQWDQSSSTGGGIANSKPKFENKDTKIEYNALTKLMQTSTEISLRNYLPIGVFITLNLAPVELS